MLPSILQSFIFLQLQYVGTSSQPSHRKWSQSPHESGALRNEAATKLAKCVEGLIFKLTHGVSHYMPYRSLLGVQVHVIDGVTNGGLTMIQNLSDAINKYQYLKCWTPKGLRFRNQDPAIRHRRGFQVSESILVPLALNC
jgi:hypothetical protein